MRNASVLFVADPIDTLKWAGDTSIAFAEGCLDLGHTVHWCHARDIFFKGTEVIVRSPQRVLIANTREVRYETGQQSLPLNSFSHAFVRTDPPFDDDYRDLCWILASQNKTKILNPAESLLSFHEKAVQWRAASEGFLEAAHLVPTCLAKEVEPLMSFAEQLLPATAGKEGGENDHKFVLKPWLGHGGSDVHAFSSVDALAQFLKTKIVVQGKFFAERWMLQPFLPEIRSEGDRRVLIAAGKVVGDFVRLPAEGRIESNLAQGGHAVARPMTSEQRTLMERLADFLTRHGITFAGVDLIGSLVSEVNITSPTGIRTVESLQSRALSKSVVEALLA